MKTSRQNCSPDYHATLLDLIEVGIKGLNQALKKFKSQKTLGFDSIAVEIIQTEISQEILK
ncbi:hypothetical protein JCM19235_5709 [Vibrio maritimus]|uniref:Uncharacterized protein n=1 Tax=Vibrio maritimus TaxID=990268 RepID=A0A090RP13_9VIBR|nr:hypothetical protein JCM19235_5709 [Vibrio maritimus]